MSDETQTEQFDGGTEAPRERVVSRVVERDDRERTGLFGDVDPEFIVPVAVVFGGAGLGMAVGYWIGIETGIHEFGVPTGEAYALSTSIDMALVAIASAGLLGFALGVNYIRRREADSDGE